MVRGALAALLSLEDDLEVVGEVPRGDAVVEAVRRDRPDVVLLDIEMPGLDGLEVARRLRAEALPGRVLMVTTFGRPGFLRAAMDAGAAGFVLKDAPAPELAVAIRRVAAGERVVDPALAVTALSEGGSPLTARETEVLAAARDHATVRELSGRLHLAQGTVRNHLSAAIRKLGARNRAEAVEIAARQGWL